MTLDLWHGVIEATDDRPECGQTLYDGQRKEWIFEIVEVTCCIVWICVKWYIYIPKESKLNHRRFYRTLYGKT